MTHVRCVPTGQGPARLHVDAAPRPYGVLVLGHGAGGGVGAADLAAVAATLPAHGVTVVRVEQPWRVAGRRVAVAPARLDAAWLDTLTAWPPGPRVVGGRSAGARVAARTAHAAGAVGVVALGFPLHPPGRPDRDRGAELPFDLPALVVQGERDPFGAPAELPRSPLLAVTPVPGADHAFAVTRTSPVTAGEALEVVVDAVRAFVVPLLRRAASGNGRPGGTRSQ